MSSTISRGDDKASLVIRHADQIVPRSIKWVWPGRIALGKITVFGGDPKLGKSHLLLHCAAVISHGGEWPCREGSAPQGTVIILSAEDSPQDTLIPRLLAYGANLEKIKLMEAVRVAKGRRCFSLKEDLPNLERMIEELKDVVLVIIDPVSVFLGANGSSNVAVRRVLAPLAEMAERLQVAVCCITHSQKAKSKKAIHAFIDSIAFAATARTAFLLLRDVEDKTRLLLLCAGSNLGKEPEGLAFRLLPCKVAGPDGDIETSVATFESEFCDKSADEMIALINAAGSRSAQRDKAKDFLLKLLAGGVRVLATDVQRQAEAAGLKYRTVCTAKAELGVLSERDGDVWYWVLR